MPVSIYNRELIPVWEGLRDRWKNCQLCPLGKTACEHVLGKGKLPADVAFIGEAPGPQEDMKGEPFIGPSGKLLTRIIGESFGKLHPYSYFVLNTLACFPLDVARDTFREPTRDELIACLPRVTETIDLVKPRAIVFVGKTAAKLPTLIKSQNPAWWDFTPHFDHTVTIFHPSYLLRRGGHHSFEYKKTVDALCSFLSPILEAPF